MMTAESSEVLQLGAVRDLWVDQQGTALGSAE